MFSGTTASIAWQRGASRRSISRRSGFFPHLFTRHCPKRTSVRRQIMNHDSTQSEAVQFFEDLWSRGDPWDLETSEYEDHRYRRLFDSVADRHYEKVLEIGCGAGAFTRRLAAKATSICALDVSETAINRALAIPFVSDAAIDYRVADVMHHDVAADAPFDFTVMTETIYYLGWLHSFFDVGSL